MSIKSKIQALITAANTATGESDTTLTDAVQTLVDGYGQGGGTDLTPFVAVAGEVTPMSDSTSLGFPTDGKFSDASDVLFFFAFVDDYSLFTDQNEMIIGGCKCNMRLKIPSGSGIAKTIQTIDTSRNPPLNYWASPTAEIISGNNYLISNSRSFYFKAGVKYNYILVGVKA